MVRALCRLSRTVPILLSPEGNMLHPPAPIIPSGFASHALQLLQKVQHGLSPVELVYTAHERWPLRLGQTTYTRPTLRISVLDASFNPPTLAHLALANSPQPSASTDSYDAHVLLLSVRNADKSLTAGDATLIQRLEMMRLLAHDVHSTYTTESSGGASQMNGNVAIGIIDEPIFVGKSDLLLRFLRTRLVTIIGSSHSSSDISDERVFPSPKLTFLMGFDTLARLFSPKYYPSEQAMLQRLRTLLSSDQQDCRIACACGRSASTDEGFQEARDRTFQVAHEYITSCRIAFIDIGTEEQAYSSTKVRTKVAAGDVTWRQLVTGAIADYIIKKKIYSSSERGH